MFSRAGHLLLILALLGATGTHWMMLQSVAWATMLADNAQTNSFAEALEKTFDGRHPCALCKQIAKGRQSERKSDQHNDLKKLEFFSKKIVLVITPPRHFILRDDGEAFVPQVAHAPPTPPPEAGPAFFI
jgi:hypothetical protein